MKFKNTKTGNIISTDNAATIALMQKSNRYEAVTKAAKGGKKSADKQDNGTTE